MSKVNSFLIPNVSSLPSNVQKAEKVNALKSGEKSEFKGLIDKELLQPQVSPKDVGQEVKVSSHAVKRLQERNISIDKDEYAKLQTAMDRLKLKGGQDSLIITSKAAYIVDVPKNTIVTAIDKDSIGENVFTKIDSTILMN